MKIKQIPKSQNLMQTLLPLFLKERREVRKKHMQKSCSRQGTMLMGTELDRGESL